MKTTTSADELIDQARAMTGLDRFDSESYREGLEVLLADMSRPDYPGPSDISKGMMVGAMANRLKATAYLDQRPELLERPIKRPVFVFGIPRTGTTLLNNLLAADPSRRSALTWEIDDPVPPPKADALYTDPRALARLEQGVGGHGDPSTLRYYRSSPIYPNECVFFMYSDFKCLIWESMGRLPAYREWILQVDMTSAYQYHKRFLQLLQADAPGVWNLKMPSHALWLDTLIKIYPDARLVWTHRDPLRATGSFCSMLDFAERLYLGKSDKEWIAFDMPDQAVEHARRAMDFSQRHPGRVIDVHYADIMREPIETMRSLYAALGDQFTPEAEHGMRSWLADNPQGKFGAHDYNLDEFGLDAAELRGRFGEYLDRYGVEPEGY